MNVLMILHQRINRFWGKFEGDLILRNHVDMYDVSFDVYNLVVEERLYQRVLVFAQLGFWGFRKHQGAQCPDCRRRRQSLGQTSKVLRHTVERSLDSVDPFESGCQPRVDFAVEDDVWCSARRKSGSRGREKGDGHGRGRGRGRGRGIINKINKIKEKQIS